MDDKVDTTPLWVKDNLVDFFPLKPQWYTNKTDNVNKLNSYRNDLKIIKHIINDQIHYGHGNLIGLWCYGPSGVGKSHTLYDLPQQISPDLYMKIKNIDPKWKEIPYGLHICDDMAMMDRADYLHNRQRGEACPRRYNIPRILIKPTLFPWHLSNSLPKFSQTPEAAYQWIRRYIIFFKGKKNLNIKLHSRGDECCVIKRILLFLVAKYKSVMRNNHEIDLGDPTSYKTSPFLMQRYDVAKQIMNRGYDLNPFSPLYYFYAWIIINTKRTKDKVGIDFRVLYKYYVKRYDVRKRKDILSMIQEVQSFGLEVRECPCDKIGNTITYSTNPSSKNIIWLIRGYTTIFY